MSDAYDDWIALEELRYRYEPENPPRSMSDADIDRQNAAATPKPNPTRVTDIAKVHWIADVVPLEGKGSRAEIGRVSLRSLRIFFNVGGTADMVVYKDGKAMGGDIHFSPAMTKKLRALLLTE
jgi:hypothetical protein